MLSELKNAVKFGDDNYDFMRKFQVWLNEKKTLKIFCLT